VCRVVASDELFAYTPRDANLVPKFRLARVAQLVEQRIENPRVTGSIPVSGTIFPPVIL
jgi:hypothetical protein